MTRILIIEDHPAHRKLVRDLCQLKGFSVLEATDAETGIELALNEPVDAIVMDIRLPGRDGLSATRTLRQHEQTRDTPILALTAHAMRGDEERILKAGCDRYVAKPTLYKDLLSVLCELIEDDDVVSLNPTHS